MSVERPESRPEYRSEADPADAEAVRRITEETGFFRPDEVEVAVELVLERIASGDVSGYHYWFADINGVAAGYVCYGPTPCTLGSFDLYWIVVARENQAHGLGRELMRLAERSAAKMGCKRMYVETSGKELYLPTRIFYKKAGYFEAARLPDFYGDGDDKLIFQKNIVLSD